MRRVRRPATQCWTVRRHAEVVRLIEDHATFSNVVSRHPAVPNGMDPPEHTTYRAVVEPYFSADRVRAFTPACRHIATALVEGVVAGPDDEPAPVEVMHGLALPFAARVQCAYFGWPADLAGRLTDWVRRSHDATQARDRTVTAAIAAEFEAMVGDLLDQRDGDASSPPRDLTETLLCERVDGQPLTRAAIASVLRNCTMGEVATLAASVGIITQFLAAHPDVQAHLRTHPDDLTAAGDEILRLNGPLVENRRVATCPVTLGGRRVARGDRVVINWIAANQDPRAFPAADTFRLDRDLTNSLLYGAGIHACPGASLARMQIGIMTETLLDATTAIRPVPDRDAEPAAYPAAGFSAVWVALDRQARA